ncbi:H/ACA ribonucleoprotein complex subunit GAR1 [Natrialbaceae archaeon A-CW3]
MRRIGTVVRVSQGLAVLRAPRDTSEDAYDAIGTIVLDDSLENVGRVVDVFGPVEEPYLAVKPDSGVHLPGLVGSALYAR